MIKQKGPIFQHGSKDFIEHNTLPPGIYRMMSTMIGPIVVKTNDLTVGNRVYGEAGLQSHRILSSWLKRGKNMGVLLSGVKGSGKTLTAKLTCMVAVKTFEIPVIQISDPFFGAQFEMFIQSFNQPLILLFDEFEKVYDCDQQNSILSFLDGTVSGNRLCLFTINATHKLSEPLIDRPGRILYHLKYDKIDKKAVIEYCEENLVNKERLKELLLVVDGFSFTFDKLVCLVEELNYFDASPIETAVKWLNIKTSSLDNILYRIEVVDKVTEKVVYKSTICHPVRWSYLTLSIQSRVEKEEGKRRPHTFPKIELCRNISTNNFEMVDFEKSVYFYENEKYTFTISRNIDDSVEPHTAHFSHKQENIE